MIPVGTTSELLVRTKIDAGFLLSNGDKDILLPKKLVEGEVSVGEKIKVFVYTDSEDRPVATMQTPLAQVGDFACLKAIDQSPHGVFLDWGLDKDLFVPKSEQHQPMTVGNSYVVAVFLDNHTNRVAAASKLNDFFERDLHRVKKDDEVDLVVYGENDRGINVIVNDRYSGLLYRDRTFARLEIGTRLKGYVDEVRRDHKLDIRLERTATRGGKAKVDDAREVILEALRSSDGCIKVGDKSTPDEIHGLLGISKKAFKAAVGGLYKSGNVEPLARELRLLKDVATPKK